MQTSSRADVTLPVESKEFWEQLLSGFTAPIKLSEIGNPRLETTDSGTKSLQLSAASKFALQEFAQTHQLHLRTIIHGAWALLLSRYSGESDVVFGELRVGEQKASHGYPDPAIDTFVNILPVRVKFQPNQTLLPWLQELQSNWVAAQKHAHIPFTTIESGSDVYPNSLFESLVIFEDAELSAILKPPGQTGRELLAQSKYPLTLFAQVESTFNLEISYSCSQFDHEAIQRLLGHLQTLLESFVLNPQQSLASLPLITAAERHQLLVDWNQTSADYPADKCIHQLFAEQAARTPEAIALVFEEQRITYQDLNQRANQLAHHLQSLGVGPDVLVGICVERSVEMLVGLLGILKAGGAYVPLDPAFPSDRLAYMLSDSQMTVLVAQQALLSILPEHQAQVVCLDTDAAIISRASNQDPSSDVAAEHLAYVIYTSGSTGKPKGVQILQGAATNFLSSMQLQPGLNGQDILLAITTISFDIAVLELYLPLLVGAQVVLASRAVVADGMRLAQLLETSQATFMQATPATWQLLLAAGWSDQSKSALKILCGGEALSPQLAAELAPKVASLWNMYGPTEATVWATVYEVKAADLLIAAQRSAISIGQPIANTQTYILDPLLQPVPIGVRGELYIGGVQLAQGYLNRPDLTTEKFIPNPFSDQPASRLYRTGDLARYLPTGDIEYISRIDNQVKIRGYRIELGEIEVVLATHPAVRQNAVIVREDLPGDKRLVAYLVSDEQDHLAVKDLRDFLSQTLPSYMIPSAFVMLAAMPLTPNGKIDRRSLPVPTIDRSLSITSFVEPRNQLEESIAQIWQQVLGIDQISVHDNFFELGGNSLLAVQLLTKLGNTLGQNLPLVTFLKAQTIEQLAAILQEPKKSVALSWSSLVPIQTDGQKPPLFLIHAVWGNVLFYRKLVKYLEPDQPVYGLQAQGIDGESDPLTSISEMAANYIKEIQKIQPQGPYYLGGFSFGAEVAFEIAQQLFAQGQKMTLLAILDAAAPNLLQAEMLAVKTNKSKNWQQKYFQDLAKLTWPERATYFLDKMQWHFTIGKLGIFYRSYLKYIKQSLPDLYLLQVHFANHQASNGYEASVYPGHVHLFRCPGDLSENSLDLGWGKLALDGVTISQIPASHTTIMEEPFVKNLAEQLTPFLPKTPQGVITSPNVNTVNKVSKV
jgi:amino acid adenylation domain-containing protein